MAMLLTTKTLGILTSCLLIVGITGCRTQKIEADHTQDRAAAAESEMSPTLEGEKNVQESQAEPELLPLAFEKVTGKEMFNITGPFDFRGTVTRTSTTPSQWTIDASMLFTSGGYEVGKFLPIMTMSIPEQVIINIPVSAPAPGTPVTLALEEKRIKEVIPASGEAIWRGSIRLSIRPEGE